MYTYLSDYGGSKHALKMRCSKISEMMIGKDEGTANLDVIRTHLDKISDRLSPRVKETLERALSNTKYVSNNPCAYFVSYNNYFIS
jgi:hypothetical protein